jgi:hypothetical protein
VNRTTVADSRQLKLLIERIAASPVVGKSNRLHDLLFYLANRALAGDVTQIHEQEVGHHVFGRPPDYDTGADNIVRVHASLLRKRLQQYFAKEGAAEPITVEIPKGHYVLLFRERTALETSTETTLAATAPAATTPAAALVGRRVHTSWLAAGATALALLFATSTIALLLKERQLEARVSEQLAARPTVHLLWSQLFRSDRPTDVVLDDASIGLYQDLVRRPIGLHDYSDRTYLRKLPETITAAKLDPDAASSVVTRRHSSYAAVTLLWKLFQISAREQGQTDIHFARDYSFHGLKTNHVVLLGSSQANRWVEPFESHLGLRWVYDKSLESAYPIDTWSDGSSSTRYRPDAGQSREGYCSIAFLPNLGVNGNVLLISATGGAAISACGDFLNDEQAVSTLRARLPNSDDSAFPYFEALLRVKARSALPRDTSIVLCRPPSP